MTDAPYNLNPELVAMKQDIADRKFHVKMKGILIGAGLLVAAAIGFAALALAAPQALPAVGEMGAPMVKGLLYGAMGIGGTIISVATIKELKQLEVDEKYLQSYMQGKNYWGEGYRKEVAEHGYAGPQVPFNGPQQLPQRNAGRSN